MRQGLALVVIRDQDFDIHGANTRMFGLRLDRDVKKSTIAVVCDTSGTNIDRIRVLTEAKGMVTLNTTPINEVQQDRFRCRRFRCFHLAL
jgi:hypothetical protein